MLTTVPSSRLRHLHVIGLQSSSLVRNTSGLVISLSPRRWRFRALVLVVALVTSGLALPAGADTVDSGKSAVAAANRDLQALLDRVSVLDEDYNAAKIDLAKLDQQLADTQAAADQAQARLDQRKAEVRDFAVRTYIHGSTGGALDAVLSGDVLERRSTYTKVVVGDGQQVMDQLAVAQQDADAHIAELEAKRAEADAKRKQLANTKAELESKVRAAQDRLDAAQSQLAQAQAQAEQARQQAAALATRSATRTPTAAQPAATPSAPLPRRVAETAPQAPRTEPPPPPPANTPSDVRAVIDEAYRLIGTPYRYGGSTPQEGFDCSGFTAWVWRKGGVTLPHSSRSQYGVTTRISRSQLRPGDLVFYGSPIHHVALYVGNGRIIHAPHSGSTVRENSIDYWDAIAGYGRVNG